jgi:hypothetical protein
MLSVRALLAAAALSLVAGCGRDRTPQLIRVSDVTPRELEVGDRLEIAGDGFPQGRIAHVRFQGTLHRPGEADVTGADVEADGLVTGPSVVRVPFDAALQARFCGAGRKATHTTFEGDVEVAFEAAAPGAPPVAGRATGVVLDVRPGAGQPSRADLAEGERTLSALGLRLDGAEHGARGLLVDAVEPASRAARAGLLPGDLVVAFGGVRAASLADVRLAPAQSTVELRVRRGATGAEQTHVVDVVGLAPASSAEGLAALVLLALAAAALLLGLGPRSLRATLAEARLAARLRSFAPSARSGLERLVRRPGTASLTAAALVPPLTVAFGPWAFGADADAAVLVTIANTAFLAAALVTRGWGCGGALRTFAHALAFVAPSSVATVATVLVTGTLRMREIQSLQGGWPWEWHAFRHPPALVLAALALAPLASPARAQVRGPLGPEMPDAARASFRFIEWIHGSFVCTLLVGLVFGGGAVPGEPRGAMPSGLAPIALSGGVLLLKSLALLGALAVARVALRVRTIADVTATTLRRTLPIALVASGAWLVDATCASERVSLAAGAVACGVTVVAVLIGALRVVQARREPDVDLQPSAFL